VFLKTSVFIMSQACCQSSVDSEVGNNLLEQCVHSLCNWKAFPDDALSDGSGSEPEEDTEQEQPPAATPATRRKRALRKMQRRIEDAVPMGWVAHRLLPSSEGQPQYLGARPTRPGPQGGSGGGRGGGGKRPRDGSPVGRRGGAADTAGVYDSGGGGVDNPDALLVEDDPGVLMDFFIGGCGDDLDPSVVPSLRPVAAGCENGGVLVCGGLLPATARELDSAEAAMQAAAAAAASGAPAERWEQQSDASRAYHVLPPRPSPHVSFLCSQVIAMGSRAKRVLLHRGFVVRPEPPMPLGAGSHAFSLVVEARDHAPFERRCQRTKEATLRRAVMFGGRIATGTTPSGRELALDAAAARDDAAQGLTNGLRVTWLAKSGYATPNTASSQCWRWYDGDEQTGDVPRPRELHSAAFARAPLRSEERDEDDALALGSVRRHREAHPETMKLIMGDHKDRRGRTWWWDYRTFISATPYEHDKEKEAAAWLASSSSASTSSAAAAAHHNHHRLEQALAAASPIERAFAYEMELRSHAHVTWRRPCRKKAGGGDADYANEDDGDGGGGFRRMYVFGGVRYASDGAGKGGFRRVPADAEAGTIYACTLYPDALDKPPHWQRLQTRAAAGEPPAAVPNTTTLLAFWAAPGGNALYAVPDRIMARGGGGYKLHRLDLRNLTWRLVPIAESGSGGGGGGGSGGVGCSGPEARFGSAAVYLPPAADEALYSGGRLVVYGGRGAGAAEAEVQAAGAGARTTRARARALPTATAAPSAASATTSAAALVHVLHLPPDAAFAAQGTLARAAHEAVRAGALPTDSSVGRRAALRLRDQPAEAWTLAWWEAPTPELYPQPGEATPPQPLPGPRKQPAAAAMLPLYMHVGATLGLEGDKTPAAVFAGGCDVRGGGGAGPSRAWQVLRPSVARPAGAPPGGSAAQRASQHARRLLALALRKGQQQPGQRRRRRQVTLRVAGGGGGGTEPSAGYTIDAQLLALYSDLFDESLQGLLPDDDEDDEPNATAPRPPPPVLPVPAPNDAALRRLLFWTQGRLSVWSLTCTELFDLYSAADALAVPSLMREARQQLVANVMSGRAANNQGVAALVRLAASSGRIVPPGLEEVVAVARRRHPFACEEMVAAEGGAGPSR
jgi:hypothetical protein